MTDFDHLFDLRGDGRGCVYALGAVQRCLDVYVRAEYERDTTRYAHLWSSRETR